MGRLPPIELPAGLADLAACLADVHADAFPGEGEGCARAGGTYLGILMQLQQMVSGFQGCACRSGYSEGEADMIVLIVLIATTC